MDFIIPLIQVINRWNKISISIFPPTNCTAIVPFNSNLYSTIGLPRLTKFIRDITYLNNRSLDILIGILLGDGYFKLGKNKGSATNVRIGFKQSIINFPFMWLVFTELSHFCSSVPRFDFSRIKGKNGIKFYGQLILETRTYPVFNELYKLFIVNGTKTITSEMYNYLSPAALAYWIMCDGTSAQYGLVICTDNFSYKDVVCLLNILKIRYDLNCSIHSFAGRPRLYIKADSMNKLRAIVKPHLIPFSVYKLQKGKRPKL